MGLKNLNYVLHFQSAHKPCSGNKMVPKKYKGEQK